MRGLGERAAGVEVFVDGGVVPIGEVSDEVEKGGSQFPDIVEEGRVFPGLLEPLATFLAE